LRHYAFLAQGVPDTARRARERGVGFVLRRCPEHSVLKFCDEVKASLVIGDENPLREPNHWREAAARKLCVPLWTVDADVLVPSKLLEKEQYAARIIRPRLQQRLERFLTPPQNPQATIVWQKPRGLHALPDDGSFDITEDWQGLDRSVQPVDSFRGGTSEALKLLRDFVTHKLAHYPQRHGKPETDGTSRLSPYLHFGHIGPHTVALAVEGAKAPRAAKDDFLGQLITWRELSINFVHFNSLYDSIESAPDWAHRTLAKHAGDRRSVIYSRQQLEQAETHDELWNAAQQQMLHAGWMHNYMRMYWAKKILEWSESPAVAYQTAVYLNDKYFLDGRDPNGYAGIAWAIAGKFDRPWFERPIFGSIRYMSGNAALRKFDADRYVEQMAELGRAALQRRVSGGHS
jgi:deoxyribodipyrimidine photo-lyase